MEPTDPTAHPARAASPAAEAARYALLRRLAPSMRHHLVVNLQPIGMIYEVMERRLRQAEPDLGHLQDSATKINGFARAALASCIDVVSWLAPDEAVQVSLADAVRESAGMLATSLSFRGYALRNEVGAVPGQVRRSAIRTLLPAVLVHVTDHLQPPAELAIGAEAAAQGGLVHVAIRPGSGERGFAAEAGYRHLEWDDLEALAEAEGVELQRTDGRVSILLPWSNVA